MLFLSVHLTQCLAPARRQAIVWTNNGYITDAYFVNEGYIINSKYAHYPTKSIVVQFTE